MRFQIITVTQDVNVVNTKAGLEFKCTGYFLKDVDVATQTGDSPAPDTYNYVLKRTINT